MFDSISPLFQIILAIAASIISIYLIIGEVKRNTHYSLVSAFVFGFFGTILVAIRKAVIYNFVSLPLNPNVIGYMQLILFILMLVSIFIYIFKYGDKKDVRNSKLLIIYFTIILLVSIYIIFFYK